MGTWSFGVSVSLTHSLMPGGVEEGMQEDWLSCNWCMPPTRGDRAGERKRRQVFYTWQDYAIEEARKRFGYMLSRGDFRQLDGAGRQPYIDAIQQVYDSWGASWRLLCNELPELDRLVAPAKGACLTRVRDGKSKFEMPHTPLHLRSRKSSHDPS